MKRQTLVPPMLGVMLLGLMLTASWAQAQDQDHTPLLRSDTLTLEQIMEQVMVHAPRALEGDVRQQQAQAFDSIGKSWLANRPALVLSMNNDAMLDDRGLRELEYGVQMPLRRFSEKRAASMEGDHYLNNVGAWESSLRWELEGQVKLLLIEMETAEVMLELEQQATESAREVLSVTEKLFKGGELARLDVLQAEQLLLTQQASQLHAEAALVDAKRGYSVLTGMNIRPSSPYREMLVDSEEIAEQHPLLQMLQSDIQIAADNVRRSETSAKGSPLLTIGSRRERGDRFTPYTDSIGIGLTIPIGGKSFVSSQSSAAKRDKVDAEVSLLTTKRSLQQALHEAEHELFITREALPLAERQALIGEERRTMANRAYAAGELTLTQVLSAVQQAQSAQKEYTSLKLHEQMLIVQYNQLIGEMQ